MPFPTFKPPAPVPLQQDAAAGMLSLWLRWDPATTATTTNAPLVSFGGAYGNASLTLYAGAPPFARREGGDDYAVVLKLEGAGELPGAGGLTTAVYGWPGSSSTLRVGNCFVVES